LQQIQAQSQTQSKRSKISGSMDVLDARTEFDLIADNNEILDEIVDDESCRPIERDKVKQVAR